MSLIFYTGNTLDQTLLNDQKLSGRIINSIQAWRSNRSYSDPLKGSRNSTANGNSSGTAATIQTTAAVTSSTTTASTSTTTTDSSTTITSSTTNSTSTNTTAVIVPPISFHKPTAGCPNADLTAKLFLPANATPNQAHIAINEMLDIIGPLIPAGSVDGDALIKIFIISLEGLSFSADSDEEQNGNSASSSVSPSVEKIADIWKQVVSAVQTRYPKLVEKYGIAELSTEKLTKLLAHLEAESAVLPSVDHINAADCCALPPGLISIAKQRGIRLLAHHDPEEMLSQDALNRVLEAYNPELSSSSYRWNWILRLTYIAHDRQVLAGNDYLVSVSPSE
ncbi:hypothetical protein AWJ20_3846 [Sugiyamaella lignohabitans]|uniref:Gamma-ECS regulatory subunit n=1 Tax=Sugiyamaella lignohabitans TaxID=796027 RepID=A0A167C063_9ASCO|nr:uncharacterized protein AWJ20_3846 [Sugiyamaella lignohabitans]ANB11050.1 hypothetical protein AWJ20_3846 [Sugiyamaella lignohabitans]